MNTTDVITSASLKDLITRAEDVLRGRTEVWPRVETAIITARQAANSAEQSEIESAYIGLEKALVSRGNAIIELAAANFDAACE